MKPMFYGVFYSALILLFLLSPLFSLCQKSSELLEKGIMIKNRNKIFLEYEPTTTLTYDVGKEAIDFIPVSDSMIFLSSRDAVNIYIAPLNPLKWSTTTDLVFTPNAVYKEASNALESIMGLINKVTVTPPAPAPGFVPNPACALLVSIKAKMTAIKNKLATNNKETVNDNFNALKKMEFTDEATTKGELKDVKAAIKTLNDFYDDLKKQLDAVEKDITEYNKCSEGTPDPFVYQFIFNQVIKELRVSYENQLLRIGNLQKAYDLVEGVQIQASKNKIGNRWFVFLKTVPVSREEISNFKLTVNEDGYTLSPEGEIVKSEIKAKIVRTLRITRYQLFVTEVAAGTAYTWLHFPKYGTEKNAAGQEVVAAAGEENFKRVNFSAMINFNLFIPNSPLHPFIQLGAGANTDYPTLFLGGGLRFNFPPLKRLAVSGGMASSWIKTLNKLKIGDTVSGTAELEKDMTHEFQFPPKGYVGIQYNF